MSACRRSGACAQGGTAMKRFSIFCIVFAVLTLTAKGAFATDFLVADNNTGNQHYQHIATDDAGGFLVVWTSNWTWQYANVLGKRYDSNGNATSAAFLLVDPLQGEQQRQPRICHRDGGGWVLIWHNTHDF